VFEKNDQLRDFLLFKFINCERMTLHTREFADKFKRSRQALLTDIVDRYINRINTISRVLVTSGSEPRNLADSRNSVIADSRFQELDKIFTPRKRSSEPLSSPPRMTSFRDDNDIRAEQKKIQ